MWPHREIEGLVFVQDCLVRKLADSVAVVRLTCDIFEHKE